MTNTIEALKKLYVAMGGTAADVANLTITPEMISAIAEIYQGGGSGLPEVTSEDNGDILKVVEGAWAKDAAPTELPAVSGTDNGKLLGVSEGAWEKVDAPKGAVTINLSETSQNALTTALGGFISVAIAASGAPSYYHSGENAGITSEDFNAITTALSLGKAVIVDGGAGSFIISSYDDAGFSFQVVFTNYDVGGTRINLFASVTLGDDMIAAYGYATLYPTT